MEKHDIWSFWRPIFRKIIDLLMKEWWSEAEETERREKRKAEILNLARKNAVKVIGKDPLTLELNYDCYADVVLPSASMRGPWLDDMLPEVIEKGRRIVNAELKKIGFGSSEFNLKVIREDLGLVAAHRAVLKQ